MNILQEVMKFKGPIKRILGVSDGGSGDMTKAAYDPANINQQVVGLTATQTLTNKTLTAPDLGTPAAINLTNATDATNKRLLTDAQLASLNALDDVDYLVGTSTATLTAERVITDTSSVIKDFATAGQAKFAVAPGGVTDAMLVDMATATVKGNPTGSTADPQNMTLTGGLSVVSGTPGALKSKNSFSFSYTFDTQTTTTDPGSGKCNFNSDQTVLYINPTTLYGQNIDGFINRISSGELRFASNNLSSAAFGVFLVTGTANDLGTYWSITGSLVAGVGALPADNEEIIITYQEVASATNVVAIAKSNLFLRRNSLNQIINESDVVISGTPVVASHSNLPDVSDYNGFTYRVADQGLYGVDYQSNGTVWSPVNGSFLHKMDTNIMPGDLIWPETTFTSATATSINSGTDIRLTSAGAHGLTSAIAVGKKIYVSAGTNWTVGFYTIKTIAVDTSGLVIDLEEPFVASMGVPTIALKGTDVPLLSLTVPPLRAKSTIHFTCDVACDTAITSSRATKVTWGGTQFYAVNSTSTTSDGLPMCVKIANLTTSTQTATLQPGNTGYDPGGTTAIVTGAFDSTADTTLSVAASSNTANVPYQLTHYELYVRG